MKKIEELQDKKTLKNNFIRRMSQVYIFLLILKKVKQKNKNGVISRGSRREFCPTDGDGGQKHFGNQRKTDKSSLKRGFHSFCFSSLKNLLNEPF